MVKTNVKILRLNTGDDIIANVTLIGETDEPPHYIVDKPMKILYLMHPAGKSLVLSLTYWVYPGVASHDDFKIFLDDVLTDMEPTEELEEKYFYLLSELLDQQAESMSLEKAVEQKDEIEETRTKPVSRKPRTIH